MNKQMKKIILTIGLVVTAALALQAESFTGPIVVTRNGQVNTTTATVSTADGGNGRYTLTLQVPVFGTMVMNDVPAATTGEITVFSAERDVATNFGMMRTTVFARVTDGMMAADVAIPAQNITMWFNTVGDHFQLPNSDFETWTGDNGEPDRWHGFKTATGTFAGLSPALLEQSEDIHNDATGQYSAVVTAKNAGLSIANGTMTNGRLNAGSWTATSTSNHASMDAEYGDNFYMPLYAKPDKFNVWLKYTQGTTNNNNLANVSVKTFDGTYYQEPVDKEYTNLSGSIVGGPIPAGDWTFYSFPIDYASYAANNAATEAIFVTFSTNGNPGQGSSGDQLYIDDIELVYLASMTDLCYQGTTIEGWDPAVTTYNMQITGAPNLDDFTATIEGASAIVTKLMEQNADGTWRIVISAVSGDLQTATAYIINVTAPTVLRGDVDGNGIIGMDDLTALINYLVFNTTEGINLENADVDAVGGIGMDDLTALINYLVYGHF